ncbi:hypothetical protein RRG08_043992 [Elysia crispata]|uniref:Uncharacterized protein n=1 Tax=Elysia crispata TaxID=231223 RepID=A0AAE1DH51_9GAST|nr:hypothetical protein RRG08_043992 [Elysia crispata]
MQSNRYAWFWRMRILSRQRAQVERVGQASLNPRILDSTSPPDSLQGLRYSQALYHVATTSTQRFACVPVHPRRPHCVLVRGERVIVLDCCSIPCSRRVRLC